jgi:ABC-2 type transport system ATP-binding protein
VSGLVAAQVGDIAFEHGVRLHELTVVRASLEAAFMELTADSVEYRAESQPAGPGQGQPPEPGQPPAPELAAQGQYRHEGQI